MCSSDLFTSNLVVFGVRGERVQTHVYEVFGDLAIIWVLARSLLRQYRLRRWVRHHHLPCPDAEAPPISNA